MIYLQNKSAHTILHAECFSYKCLTLDTHESICAHVLHSSPQLEELDQGAEMTRTGRAMAKQRSTSLFIWDSFYTE